MYESSGSQFFRTTTGIQSGPNVFNHLGSYGNIMQIQICSRLVFQFLEKFLANKFTLSDAEDNSSGLLNRGSITDLRLMRTLFTV